MAADAPWAGRRLHLIGIAGAGMSGYALAARALGASVSGSDRAESPYLEPLRAQGVELHIGHDAAHVPPDADVFHSSAIAPDNPERAAAGERSRPRAALLAELTALRRTIAVAGAHGKTTTTSMVAHALLACGLDPGYLIGGELRSTGRNAHWGTGEWLVVEADESDRSFLSIDAEIAVVTNIELDHHATYGSHLELEEAMGEFLAAAPRAVVWDRPELVRLRGPGEIETFDVLDPALEPGGSRFGWRGHEVHLRIPGAHNANNAAAALETCRLVGADEATAAASLAQFTGAGRRFERLGATPQGTEVYDDYAHHPTEVAATLAAARTLGPRRLIAAFQPHLYSRTRALHRQFGAALAAADAVAVLDVYPARERPEDFPGVTGRLVAEAAADHGAGRPVFWLPRIEDAVRVLARELRAGDLCLTLGAGDVDELGRRLVTAP